MPVIMNLPRPTVNYVGNTETTKQSPALDPNGFERRQHKYVTMVSPEGVEEQILADNVRDFERLKGYKRKSIKLPPPVVGAEANRQAEESTPTAESVGQARLDEQKAAMDYLGTLRKTATDLGITIDNRWGIARLRNEIEAKGGTVPERADDND